jgi:hypothetical protein
MKRRIIYSGTLFYCDGIQVFEGKDEIGGNYVGVLSGDLTGEPEYVIVGINPWQLQQFRLGKVDLRSLMVQRPYSEWLAGPLLDSKNGLLVDAEPQNGSIPEPCLPEEGFVLSLAPSTDAHLVRHESIARNNLAFEVALDTRIPSDEHRVRANTLGGLLIHIQSLVGNAYRKAKSLSRGVPHKESNPLLDVAVGAAAGSFKVLLVPSQLPNLFNQSELSEALEIIDFVLSDSANPKQTLERVQKYAGHTAKSLVRLLQFIIANDVSLSYSWAAPDRDKVSSRYLPAANASLLLATLSTTENIATEKAIISGVLRKIDMDAGTWRLKETTTGEEYSGKLRPGITLSNLVSDRFYTFECEEEIESVTATGREIHTLFLVRSSQ